MLNPVRETPVLELDDGSTITQSNAILAYLAHGTAYLPEDRLEQAQVHQWLAFEQERVMGGIGGPRFRRLTGRPEIPGRLATGRDALAVLDAHLQGREWLVGDGPTIADVSVFAYAHVAPDAGSRSRPLPRRGCGGCAGSTASSTTSCLRGERLPHGQPQHLRLTTAAGARRLRRHARRRPRPRGAPPRRARGAPRRGGAGGRAGALPLDRRRPRPARRADRRHRLDVDGHDAVQLHPARALRRGRRGRRRGGRRRAPVQHDRGLRQPVAGHARHARLADLARGDRRLDRADGDRARLRRARLHRRLRQDDAGGADGARAPRQAGGAALQRPAARRAPGRTAS